MRNMSRAFVFLNQIEFWRAMYFPYLEALGTLFKIICMQKIFAQNMEVQVSLMEFLLQIQGSFAGFFI